MFALLLDEHSQLCRIIGNGRGGKRKRKKKKEKEKEKEGGDVFF